MAAMAGGQEEMVVVVVMLVVVRGGMVWKEMVVRAAVEIEEEAVMAVGGALAEEATG